MKVKKVQRFTLHGNNEFVLAKDYDSRERELLASIAQLQSELAATTDWAKETYGQVRNALRGMVKWVEQGNLFISAGRESPPLAKARKILGSTPETEVKS